MPASPERSALAPRAKTTAACVAGSLAAALVVGGCSAAAPPPGSEARPRRRHAVAIPTVEAPAAISTPRLSSRVAAIHEAFDDDRAMRTVAFVEQFFRVRGNRGYAKSLEHVERELREAGFPDVDIRALSLGPVRPAWTPVRASLALVTGTDAGADEPLHAFENERERDRATLLVGSASTPSTVFEVVLAESARPPLAGKVVLGSGEPAALHRRFVVGSGAAGILTKNLVGYHRPDRHEDAAQFGYLRADGPVVGFGFSISPRVDARLRAALARGPTRVRVAIETTTSPSAATGIECTLRGSQPGAPPIVMVAHVDEPGANDNASGVAALLELARTLRTLSSRAGATLRRSIILLWGMENEVADAWLDARGEWARPMVGLVLDMVGQDPAVVRAPFLVERTPDPGAVWLRAPDQHTEWGSTEVDPSRIHGHWLNDHVIAATRARGALEPGFAWSFRSHPFEGGSDHTSFLEVGVPAVLAWHFPDDAYHTTRDRLDRVSGAEIERVASVMGGVALTLATATSDDVDELLAIVEHAARERWAHVAAGARRRGAALATEHRIAEAWAHWYGEALDSVRDVGPPSAIRRDDQHVGAAVLRWRAASEPLLRATMPTR